MQPKVHSALISQLVSISLRKPLLFPRWVGSPSLSTETGPRRLFRPFTFDPCRPSSYFLDRHRAALSSRSSGGPLSLSLSFFQVALRCIFCLALLSPFSACYPSFLSIAVIRLRLHRRLFSPALSRSILSATPVGFSPFSLRV